MDFAPEVPVSDAWNALTDHMSEVSRLAQIQGLLSWDQQVNLPPAGHSDRGAHAALISSLIQARATDPKVGEWLSAIRVSSAANWLLHSDASLEEIAERVGWADRTHFTRQFRKAYGTTPAAWRAQMRHRPAETIEK